MSAVFADSGFWIALLDPDDDLHPYAMTRFVTHEDDDIVTSQMVLLEVLAFFSNDGAASREDASALVRRILNSADIEVVPMTDGQFRSALERYENRLDQSWSLVDCASFLVMEERGITDALAYDRDFAQAGFVALLRNTSA